MEEDSTSSGYPAEVPLVIHLSSNYGIQDRCRSAVGIVSNATIWGGSVGNCAEDQVSTFVEAQREHLCRFIYLPQRHKGHPMERLLCRYRDPSTTMEFPKIKTLGYSQYCGTPLDNHWIVPNLETLYVFGWNDDVFIDCWKATKKQESLPMCVLKESPNIKEIIVAQPNFSAPFQFQILRRLYPGPLKWPTFRLLQLVMKKENPVTCPMAKLPESMINHILPFCPHGHFECVDYIVEEEDEEGSNNEKDQEVVVEDRKAKAEKKKHMITRWKKYLKLKFNRK